MGKSKKYFSELSDKFNLTKNKQYIKNFNEMWQDDHNSNPLEITKEFIKQKGLKIYGGLALHKHLKKHKKPLYNLKTEFPDYDVFSPNAWEHAKELANILFNLGYYFVEARSSILNNDKHQTYKVSVDMEYILDITQAGCTTQKLIENDCKKCGISNDKKCISIFNHIPCYEENYSIKQNPKIYTKTYNYDTNSSYYPNKLLICSPNWLKISMYRELTEPLSNPDRLEKVATRLELFNKHYKFKYDCVNNNNQTFKGYNNNDILGMNNVLNYIKEFIKKHKLINYGIIAYNMFIKNNKKNIKQLNVIDYNVYDNDIFDEEANPTILLNELIKQYPNYKFKIEKKISYWKEIDVNNCIILGKPNGKKKYNELITFTNITECLPYIQYNGMRYVTIDRLKYQYYRAVSLNNVMKYTERNNLDYGCLLKNILSVDNTDKGKFRKYVLQCEPGDSTSAIYDNLLTRFGDKLIQTKKTRYKLNKPRKGYLTKIYPIPSDDIKFPYKPAENEIKKYRKIYSKMQEKNKKTKRISYNNIL